MIRVTRLTCLIALPLTLAACGDKKPDANAMAAGEILEGTTSDAMLPLDTVRSQPPLAPRTDAAKVGGRAVAEAEADDESTDSTAAPADAGAGGASAGRTSSSPSSADRPRPRPLRFSAMFATSP